MSDPFELRDDQVANPEEHVFGKQHVCRTEMRGQSHSGHEGLFEIVVGMAKTIPLWATGVVLRYRFDSRSFRRFADPEAAKAAIRGLLGKAIAEWGAAAPVAFAEKKSNFDFEIVARNADDCDINGCVLASSFFPGTAQQKLTIYPRMFEQSAVEQIATIVHELGHVFGLRHYFAQISETQWASQTFGTHNKFSIMNYGEDSILTDADRADLRDLYSKARSGTLTHINVAKIELFKPFSALSV